jgi:hypothetical protein
MIAAGKPRRRSKMILNVISDKEIKALREEAQKNGDLDRVKICDLALNGNEAANILCARTLFDEQEKSLDSLDKRKAALADFEKQYVLKSGERRGNLILGPYEGDWYSLVTTGPIYFGQLVGYTETDYHLMKASWVVETGRRHQYIRNPQIAPEREYIGYSIVPRGAVNGVEWHEGYQGGPLETK